MLKMQIAASRSFVNRLPGPCYICRSISFFSSKVNSSFNPTQQKRPNSSQSQVATHSLLNSIIGTTDPLILNRWEKFKPNLPQTKTAWIDQLTSVETGYPQGFVTLHPDVWNTQPRLDLLNKVVKWQETYRRVEWDFVPNRGELVGGGPKPWPQKGTGKARHGSDRAPQWRGGGKSFGPRGPTSFYRPMSQSDRAHAMRIALTCKYLQDDIKIVADFAQVTTTDEQFLSDVRESRNWGFMVLFVGKKDLDSLPGCFKNCVTDRKDVHYLSVSMLSVQTLLTFPTVVMDVATLEELEARLLFQMHKFSEESQYPGTTEVLRFMQRLYGVTE